MSTFSTVTLKRRIAPILRAGRSRHSPQAIAVNAYTAHSTESAALRSFAGSNRDSGNGASTTSTLRFHRSRRAAPIQATAAIGDGARSPRCGRASTTWP